MEFQKGHRKWHAGVKNCEHARVAPSRVEAKVTPSILLSFWFLFPLPRDCANEAWTRFPPPGFVPKAALVPRRPPGRKPTRPVLTAVRMRSENATWPDTYRAVIHGFDDLPPYEKSYQAQKLRRACAAPVKRNRRAQKKL